MIKLTITLLIWPLFITRNTFINKNIPPPPLSFSYVFFANLPFSCCFDSNLPFYQQFRYFLCIFSTLWWVWSQLLLCILQMTWGCNVIMLPYSFRRDKRCSSHGTLTVCENYTKKNANRPSQMLLTVMFHLKIKSCHFLGNSLHRN